MKKNNFGFSIIFAMGFSAVLIIVVIVLIEYLIPFSKNVKGSENSTKAYYQSLAGIEQALYEKKKIGLGEDKSGESSGNVKYAYSITASGKILPPVGQGNSEFDKDWNKIGFGEPIQLKLISKDIDWSKVKFYFRVPDLNGNGANDETLEKIGTDNKIINWQYSGSGYILNSASGNIITVDEINGNEWKIDGKTGIIIGSNIERQVDSTTGEPLPPPTLDFENFDNGGDQTPDNYNSHSIYLTPCKYTTCTLKMSVINKLIVKQNGKEQEIPYLEYKIEFLNPNPSIPTRFSRINSDGVSYGFKKTIKIKIPQYTTSEALDFTVFQ